MAKIKIFKYEPDYDVIPQAIFWRALRYFTMNVRNGEDGLDEFKAASFTIGNDIRFDLRAYAGHPELTVTLYLPNVINDQVEISRIIKIVIRGMAVPKTAVAWQRGEPIEYGNLKRPRADRLREAEARILALKIAAQRPNRAGRGLAPINFGQLNVIRHFPLYMCRRRRPIGSLCRYFQGQNTRLRLI